MTKQENQDSPAMEFIRLAWKSACSGIPHSWERFNDTVGEACRMAAGSFRWFEGDVERLLTVKNSRFSILRCITGGGLEELYRVAVMHGNLSFCTDFERYLGRSPIIADNTNGRQRDRICIGSTFTWKDEDVTVTSFNKDGKAIACSYRPMGERKVCPKCQKTISRPESKVVRRYSISADDIQADRAERKRAAKAKRK